MSDKIPLEIQIEIIQRIPDIRSVIQYRSVSKAWKSMIDSKEFVTGHTLLRHIRRQHQPHRLLISGRDIGDPHEVKYVSIDDDDTFPNHKFNVFVPDSVKLLSIDVGRFVGSSHGLFCLFDYEKNMVIIWNPSIRKTVLTVLPDGLSKLRWIDVGFGVCPNTLDPKLVKIPFNNDYANTVQVFTLSSRAWRSPLSSTFPRNSIGFGSFQAIVDGFIYWNAFDTIIVDGLRRYDYLIMSFDLTNEEFTELYLPKPPHGILYVSNLRESLGVFEFNCDLENFNVWIMKGHGCTRSFEKLYNITPSNGSINMTLGFRRSGAPIVKMQYDQKVALAVCDPETKDITEICSNEIEGTFRVHSYMETLLLLDH